MQQAHAIDEQEETYVSRSESKSSRSKLQNLGEHKISRSQTKKFRKLSKTKDTITSATEYTPE